MKILAISILKFSAKFEATFLIKCSQKKFDHAPIPTTSLFWWSNVIVRWYKCQTNSNRAVPQKFYFVRLAASLYTCAVGLTRHTGLHMCCGANVVFEGHRNYWNTQISQLEILSGDIKCGKSHLEIRGFEKHIENGESDVTIQRSNLIGKFVLLFSTFWLFYWIYVDKALQW